MFALLLVCLSNGPPPLKDSQVGSMADWQPQGLAVQRVALPLHIQKLQQLLNLGPLIGQVEKTFRDDHSAGGTL